MRALPMCDAVTLLGESQAAAKKNFWWPFTQHLIVPQDSVTVIDSRCGESFAVYQPGNKRDTAAHLEMQYDACASWWTQVTLLLV